MTAKPMSPKNKPSSEKNKMAVILKEMALTIFVHPEKIPLPEAAVSLLFSHVAWNRSIGIPIPATFYNAALSDIEASNLNFWKELKFNDKHHSAYMLRIK